MKGLMMNRQLLISSLIEHGAKVYHDREIVSRDRRGSDTSVHLGGTAPAEQTAGRRPHRTWGEGGGSDRDPGVERLQTRRALLRCVRYGGHLSHTQPETPPPHS